MEVARQEGCRFAQRARDAGAECIAACPQQNSVEQGSPDGPHSAHHERCVVCALILVGVARERQVGGKVPLRLFVAVLERLTDGCLEDSRRRARQHEK
eukprot:2243928-Prymnesium_polylepis.1